MSNKKSVLDYIPGFRSRTKWKMILSGFIYFILIASFVGSFSEEAEPVKPEPEKEMTMEEKLIETAEKAIGKTTNHSQEEYKQKFKEVIFNVDNTAHFVLIGSDNLSENYIRGKMLMDFAELSEEVFKNHKEVEEVSVDWMFPLVDPKGHVELNRVMSISITAENNSTINWENVITDNIPKIVDYYWVHPALK